MSSQKRAVREKLGYARNLLEGLVLILKKNILSTDFTTEKRITTRDNLY